MKRVKVLLLAVITLALLTTINASAQQGQQGDEPEYPRSRLLNVIDSQQRYTPQLVANPRVVGTGVSVDESGRGVIKVYASSPEPRGIPSSLDGHPVVVQVTGPFVALQQAPLRGHGGGGGGGDRGGDPFDTTARYRPAPIGVSSGHPDITAGTIGARVTNSLGQVFALSNNHVYAAVNQASIGEEVLQPGAFDGGTLASDVIGTLADYVPLLPGVLDVNIVDAAIAEVDPGDLLNNTPPDGYGVPKSTPIEPAIGMRVQKYGRTTGQTRGRISDLNVFTVVQYGPNYFLWFDQQILVTGRNFSAGGDSGSLVVGARGESARRPVGLLFAGGSDTTLLNPIDVVLAAFDVTIDGEG